MSTASYLTTLVTGVIIAVVVGQLLRRVGYDYLRSAYAGDELTTSLNHLLLTLFHLFALGLVGVVSTAVPWGLTGVQLIVTKTGLIMLVLGGVYGLTVLALALARRRRREDAFQDRLMRPGGRGP